ncbi:MULTISPECIES: LacI family DNA-binding transcriptional regulator [unclassified Sporolactobacillus]|uniref:LacI family DNA-binding transcriptional regulator n=1 Tax=unclassified Sporolactobacillus TaxID=2628533 RepID=UPI002367C64C|nr:LacI family DNA-binding transcriptional regulator [Sporolactobacillus sp. CQH2019]MDD9149991.1 LacI family DNA-binding transcriptional regulator [Sporolactobacillus sp. CQH2019]
MRLKMSDIARMANVSKSAVSLAINGKPGISEETRNKIISIITEQGYTPLRKTRRTPDNTIGEVTFLVVTTSGVVQDNYRSLPFFNSLISALSATVSQMNSSLRTMTIQGNQLPKKLDEVAAASNSGVLVLGTDLTREQTLMIKRRLQKVVFLDTYFEDVVADFVTMDNYQGARLAGKYMLDQGYRNIGYFASDKPMSNFNERRRGFREALLEAGVIVANQHFYLVPPTNVDPKGLNLNALGDDMPEAIFCEDDYIAIRLIKAAQKAGLNIPRDLAVMGFDDIQEARLISPELSTIHVEIEQIADQALHQLLKQQSNAAWYPQKTLIATTLVKRESL